MLLLSNPELCRHTLKAGCYIINNTRSLNIFYRVSIGTADKNQCRHLASMTSARKRPDPITLTPNAASRIKELIQGKPDVVGVRISVKRRGCNGYSYTMNYADQTYLQDTKDERVVAHGVNVFVDPKAIFYLVGTQMDYSETALSSEFTFENPNSKGSCGCGESFNV